VGNIYKYKQFFRPRQLELHFLSRRLFFHRRLLSVEYNFTYFYVEEHSALQLFLRQRISRKHTVVGPEDTQFHAEAFFTSKTFPRASCNFGDISTRPFHVENISTWGSLHVLCSSLLFSRRQFYGLEAVFLRRRNFHVFEDVYILRPRHFQWWINSSVFVEDIFTFLELFFYVEEISTFLKMYIFYVQDTFSDELTLQFSSKTFSRSWSSFFVIVYVFYVEDISTFLKLFFTSKTSCSTCFSRSWSCFLSFFFFVEDISTSFYVEDIHVKLILRRRFFYVFFTS